MKKALILSVLISILSISSISCVMRVGAEVPVRVNHRGHNEVKLLVVPASIRIGDIVLIGNERCIIKKKKRDQIKVVYPNGTVRWVGVRYK